MPPLLPRVFPPVLLGLLAACAPSPPSSEDCDRYGLAPSPPPSTRHLTCTSTACGNGLNPPTGGDHCADTLPCRVHTEEPNRCVWIHNLEHGHAVFLYNCPEGCPELVSALETVQREAAVGVNGVRRALVAPDSRLPTRVAAIVWRRAWTGDTADLDALRCVLRLQDADAPEAGLACLP